MRATTPTPDTDDPGRPPQCSRRAFLGATAVGVAAATAGVPTARAQTGVDLEAWFEDVENYDGVVDERGSDAVTVRVGAADNGGGFAFEPAAVRVDPGTTVRWEWTGDGGTHNVASESGAYESDLLAEAGSTFDHVFDADGPSLYACTPHKAMGMKGAVLVGNVPAGATASVSPDYGDWFAETDNFAGTVDKTGEDSVTIAVGAPGNGGAHAFEPAAVHVDPGTTVRWEWTGDGGEHNVVDEAHGVDSGVSDEAGHAYSLTFSGDGVSKYACTTGPSNAMRGAVVVGDPAAGTVEVPEEGLLVGGALVAALLSPLGFAATLRYFGDEDSPPADATTDQRTRRLTSERDD